ncbi:hypothetical protein SALBM311S_09428 [Streptomyces alboniger]
MKNLKKAAAVTMVAGGLIAAGAGMASATDAHADGKAVGSPGVASGNLIPLLRSPARRRTGRRPLDRSWPPAVLNSPGAGENPGKKLFPGTLRPVGGRTCSPTMTT